MPRTREQSEWPNHLRPGAVRFAHASPNYDTTIAFYRDIVGLPVIGEFSSSFGEDGTIFGFPDTTVQLEVVRARPDACAAAGSFDQLVLYLDDADAVRLAAQPLRDAGVAPEPDQHPYWAANGAVTYQDPDGRDLVFAPWVFGRDQEPIELDAQMRIDWYDGDRNALQSLFAEAEDSAVQLDAYMNEGRVLTAWHGADLVGHLQLIPAADGDVELKNMAVVEELRGTGVGRMLVDAALDASRAEGRTRMIVATAAADTGNLRFYQRCGFRMTWVEWDAFTPANGYPEPVVIDGIPLRDRVWLDQPLTECCRATGGTDPSGPPAPAGLGLRHGPRP